MTAICLALNDLVPKRTANLIGVNPVINAKIRNLRNKKSRMHKKWKPTGDLEDYHALNYEVRMERKKSIMNGLEGDSKQYWKTINTIMGRNITEEITLTDKGAELTDQTEVANLFSEFFKNKVEDHERNSHCEAFDVPDLNGWITEDMFFDEIEVSESIQCLK